MGRRVIVVEDNVAVLELVVEVLDQAGYDVSAAPSLASARRALAAGPVDLVVADVGLGDADGRSLVDAVDASGRRLRVILMSGYGASTVDGAEHFLEKPFTPADLLASVEAALA